MTKTQAKKIFDKYNPASAVVRCPNGRSIVRKELDDYATAAVNLYGVISLTEFANIFNRYSIEKTTAGEVFALLLPLAIKSKWYCFYKNCIVHYWAIEDFDYAEYLLHRQSDKPRYIPEKDEFLKYRNEYYEDEKQREHWKKLHNFIVNEWPENLDIYRFYHKIKELSELSTGLQEINEFMDEFDLTFESKEHVQEFFDLIMNARNNSRLRINKGHTPDELYRIMEAERLKNSEQEIIIQPRIKTGMNEPCPCGSGKKYKKCCRLIEEAQTAQLTRSECVLFYETWYGLMGFINERNKILNAKIKPVYPNPISDEQIYKIREKLWENPEVIDEYIAAAKLTAEKVELLTSWRIHHKKGMYILMAYTPEYAVVIGPDDNHEDILYGIKGISQSVASAHGRELPIIFEAILLPFQGKIIYDSFMAALPIGFADGAKRGFQDMYDAASERGIITCFE